MMPRYIDAERMPSDKFWEDLTDKEKAKVLAYLLASPTTDVTEVRHGHWVKTCVPDVYQCSVCKKPVKMDEFCDSEILREFCPKCGAKMDGGNDDKNNSKR